MFVSVKNIYRKYFTRPVFGWTRKYGQFQFDHKIKALSLWNLLHFYFTFNRFILQFFNLHPNRDRSSSRDIIRCNFWCIYIFFGNNFTYKLNTGDHFLAYFLECNQTIENIFLFRNIFHLKKFYTEKYFISSQTQPK